MSEQQPKIVGNIPKLAPKNIVWVFPLFLSCFMSAVISLVNLFLNNGFIEGFFSKWLAAWLLSWVIAYPVVLIALPLMRRLTAFFVNMPK